jgi:glycosyltransferase involved in cell wall biosynthesis
MQTHSTISLIIPVYNGEAFIADALASVQAQKCLPGEIVVIDDGSTDCSAQIAEDMGVSRVVHIPHSGLPAARTRGLKETDGDFISILDADDILPGYALELLSSVLSSDEKVDIATGSVQLIRGAEQDGTGSWQVQPITSAFPCFTFGGSLIRRRAFDTVGCFNEGLAFSDDVDWFLRAREAGCTFAFQDQLTLYYRRHQGNMTRHREKDIKGLLRSFKLSLDRRRKNGRAVQDFAPLGVGRAQKVDRFI